MKHITVADFNKRWDSCSQPVNTLPLGVHLTLDSSCASLNRIKAWVQTWFVHAARIQITSIRVVSNG